MLICPDIMAREGTWDPQLLCGVVLHFVTRGRTRTLRQLGGRVIEGFRGVPASLGKRRPVPVYRPSNIGELELLPEPEHFQPPEINDDRCVRAGDIVVAKGTPVRAALASPTVFRHLVDANSFLIRGLDQGVGLWVALCLNQPTYGDYLIRKSGVAVVPRIRLSVLRNSPFPISPPAIAPMSQRVFDCLASRIDHLGHLFRFMDDVRREVASWLPESTTSPWSAPARGRWYAFFSPPDIDNSLVPRHVQVNSRQRVLRKDLGWIPLDHLVRLNGQPSSRVPTTSLPVRTLQLSDIREDFAPPRGQARTSADTNRRIFADPIDSNEVLLSTLVTNPRVTFAAIRPEKPVHPSDHWCRLHFRETPGAWAAILTTPAIHEQLRRLGIGTVQQFTQPATIGRLVLPDIPLETRIKWDSFLRRWQQGQRDIDERWTHLVQECYDLLRQTHHSMGPWSVPPAML